MPTLSSVLTDPSRRERVLDDCVKMVDEEVDGKTGLTGIGIKTAFGLVKRIKPGFVRGALDAMLDDFCNNLEGLYQDYQTKGGGNLVNYFVSRKSDVAEALLSISDERARRSTNSVAKGAYEKLRPTGKKHVEEAVPRLARMVETHVR